MLERNYRSWLFAVSPEGAVAISREICVCCDYLDGHVARIEIHHRDSICKIPVRALRDGDNVARIILAMFMRRAVHAQVNKRKDVKLLIRHNDLPPFNGKVLCAKALDMSSTAGRVHESGLSRDQAHSREERERPQMKRQVIVAVRGGVLNDVAFREAEHPRG